MIRFSKYATTKFVAKFCLRKISKTIKITNSKNINKKIKPNQSILLKTNNTAL